MQVYDNPKEMSLAEEVLKELDEMEQKRRDEQHDRILEAFRERFKDNGSTLLHYTSVIYDEVRQQLEKEGFSVRTVTYNSYGTVSYLITKKEDSHILESELESSII